MWGSLPVPKYIAHTIYADNAQTEVAFRQGEIDVGQIFVPNVQDLWEEEGLPVSGYMLEEPYGICLTMPTAWYNLNNPVLQDATLRKAIAIAVDSFEEGVAVAKANLLYEGAGHSAVVLSLIHI